MGVALELRGARDRSDPMRFLERVEAWLRDRDDEPAPHVERGTEEAILLAELHPAAEPIRLVADERSVHLSAKTGTAGPGFHRHVCALALALAEAFDVRWALEDEHGDPVDETGWLHDGDEVALEEAFLDWLGAVAAQILELAGEGARGFALSMPAGHVFEHDGVVATPLGPRDEGWLRAVVADPREGTDVFAWWSAGRDAAYYRGLALVAMWSEVRWRPPVTDAERALLERVATWVERAHGLDPALELPWAEQSALLELLGEESLRATRAHVKAQARGAAATIGYRRRPVLVQLSGGWRITIPGELAERWEERGTWVAWDAKRSVWFTSLTVRDAEGAPSPDAESTLRSLPPLEGEEVLELERGALKGLAAFVEEERDGERIHRLEAHAAVDHHAAVGTLVFVDPADRDWSLTTWGSLERPAR
ncbi:MAG TPA: hypothetical protein RMH99_20735 [Sandaracinaceae bacterium LLY-WYZ-13_1]|nr:hypothetical protein [Sandaracinaceae bacterium LLY-WYZ-13_1]